MMAAESVQDVMRYLMGEYNAVITAVGDGMMGYEILRE